MIEKLTSNPGVYGDQGWSQANPARAPYEQAHIGVNNPESAGKLLAAGALNGSGSIISAAPKTAHPNATSWAHVSDSVAIPENSHQPNNPNGPEGLSSGVMLPSMDSDRQALMYWRNMLNFHQNLSAPNERNSPDIVRFRGVE
jgi:hypothetical protein